jgi:uncharacterized protein with HEPN domain
VIHAEARDPAYLEHMLEAIARIQRYVGRKQRAGFLRDALLQDAVIRNIEIIGEAASRLSPEFAARHAEIPWRDIVGMRHRLIHGYLKVNLDTVWEVVERGLLALVPRLRALRGPQLPPVVEHRTKKPSRRRVPAKRRR